MKSEDSIAKLLDSGLDFALYRFPGDSQPYLVLQKDGQAEVLNSSLCDQTSSLNSTCVSGFVFAPFAETKETPTLLIRADVAATGWDQIEQEIVNLPRRRSSLSANPLRRPQGDVFESEEYKKAFYTFKYQLDRGNYHQLSLSYSQLDRWSGTDSLPAVFLRLMEQNPGQMVYLVSTRTGGRWIGSSPELLLEGFDRRWRTMARDTATSDYIQGQLQGLTSRIIFQGTDFTFFLQRVIPAYTLACLMHPTPSVCGLPKDEAWRFIRLHEHNRRMYYGGYLGPVNLRTDTRLYVNTSCVNIRPQGRALFYAGEVVTGDSNYNGECEKIKAKITRWKKIGG